MLVWDPSELERVIGTKFELLDADESLRVYEAYFSMAGLEYSLTIFPERKLVWMRADLDEAAQATPQFECCFGCDRIRVSGGDWGCGAIYFDKCHGDSHVDEIKHSRLVITRVPDGSLCIWPVLDDAEERIVGDQSAAPKDRPAARRKTTTTDGSTSVR